MEELVNGLDTRKAYSGVSVGLTGHSGFKGAWLALMLRSFGARVHGISLEPPSDRPNLFDECDLANQLETSTIGDIRNAQSLMNWIHETAPEIVFHLAAQSLVRQSYVTPSETFDTNVMGLVNLLEAVRKQPSVRAVVVVTTDKCYANEGGGREFQEKDPLGGADPYSASKAAAELVTASYRRSYFECEGHCLIASARAGNVIGGGDWAENRLVPDIIRALSSERPIVLRNPNSIRPWQHVLEPLSGYLKIGGRLLAGDTVAADAWNIGPVASDQWTVQQIAEHLISCWGSGNIEYDIDLDAPKEAPVLRLDATKIDQLLGIRPTLSIDRALKMTVDWYRARSSAGENALELTIGQIDDYFSCAGWNE
jgi:CDP-glucose 4,6-dehydratase